MNTGINDHTTCLSVVNSISDTMYVIGGKWKVPIIAALREGKCRFNDIQRTLGVISARVLSNELKDLELNGFVQRVVHDKTPVFVEYKITEYAATLGPVLTALADWGYHHREKIKRELVQPELATAEG
ncbi:MAG: transcriptional regulator [Chitinophagaceae bacterium]|nr:MAG: transcriptional regulator [Chitinophagaceae bacterium]